MKIPNGQTIMYSIVLIGVFVWIGFVCSISFMEAWLKFRAPNVSLQVGLSIGKLVFAALNKVEWVLGVIITIIVCLNNQRPSGEKLIFLLIPIIILILQTLWLLPFLNERAEKIIQGMDVPSSSLHFYYIFLEFIKVLSLFALGICAIERR